MLTEVTDVDMSILKELINVNHGLKLTLGKVGQRGEGVCPPRIRVTNRSQPKTLTEVVDLVG